MNNISNALFTLALSANLITMSDSANAVEPTSLRPYYVYYQTPGTSISRDNLVSGFPPEVRVVGGGVDPPNIVNSAGSFAPVDRMIGVAAFFESPYTTRSGGYSTGFAGPLTRPCTLDFIKFPWAFAAGYQLSVSRGYHLVGVPALPMSIYCKDYDIQTYQLPELRVQDRFSFLAPIRRKATDGSEYEASPMVQQREGLPWMTYYAGYRLGFVASESNWVASNLGKAPMLATWPTFPDPRDNFELAKLPRPFVEGEVVEYVNEKDFPKSPGGQFFYATSQADQSALDATANWWRTGQSFKNGGYVPVCRLYGSAVPGPNTHFYSADAEECKSLQSNPALHYEGTPFHASRLIPSATVGNAASCPTASIALYRGYNNPSGTVYDPNHRYVTNRDLLTKMLPLGWMDEGAVMCVPE